jgi:hypothetical protein
MLDGTFRYMFVVKALELLELIFCWVLVIALPFFMDNSFIENHIIIWIISIILCSVQIFDRNVLCTNLRFKCSKGKGLCWNGVNAVTCNAQKKSCYHARPWTNHYIGWFVVHLMIFVGLIVWVMLGVPDVDTELDEDNRAFKGSYTVLLVFFALYPVIFLV